MITAIGILLILIVFVWDGIVIFFLDGDIENLFEDEDEDEDKGELWSEPKKESYPNCQKYCSLRGSDYCIYNCYVEQFYEDQWP